MTELVIDFITLLNGYGAADGWPGWWGLKGHEYLARLGDQPEADFTVLMGATTYQAMYGFASSGKPGTDSLTDVPKVVFSSTLTEPPEWANSTLVTPGPSRSSTRHESHPRHIAADPGKA